MASLSKIVVEISGDPGELEAALGRANRAVGNFSTDSSSKLGSLGSAFSKVGTIAGGFLAANVLAKAGGAVTGFVGDSITAANDLNEAINAVNVVFGDAADIIHKFGETSAETAGLSAREFDQLAAPIGAMLKNLGLSADEAANATVDLGQRAADMASIFNTDVSDALGAISAGLRGEADPLERYGVSLKAAKVEAKALAMGLGEVVVDQTAVNEANLKAIKATSALSEATALYGENSMEAREASVKLEKANAALLEASAGKVSGLTDEAKAQAALALIMEQTNDIAGDFTNTSDQLANKSRITTAKMEEMQAMVGQKLLPVMLKITEVKLAFVELLANKVIPALEELYAKHWPAVSDAVKNAVETVQSWWPKLEPIFAFIFDFYKTKVEGFIQTTKGIFEIITGLVDFFTAVVHGDWKAAWDSLGTIAEGVLNVLVGSIKQTFGNIPGIILGAAGDAARAAGSWAQSTINSIINWFETLPGKLLDAGRRAADSFLAGLGNVSVAGISVNDVAGFFGRAGGGPVTAGSPVLVGERGVPELFVPSSAGQIVPLSGGAGGGVNVSVQVETLNLGTTGSGDYDLALSDLGFSVATELQSRGVA